MRSRRVEKMRRLPAGLHRPPPLLGEHTDELLRELGLEDADMARLREEGAI